MDWQAWREQFPITQYRVHLNHAGISPVSLRVVEAVREFIEHAATLRPGMHAIWEQRAEAVRGSVATLIGARPHEIGFVKNTSEGLSLVAAGVAWRDGDNVVAVDGEYPSNVYPWWSLRRFGVETRMINTALAEVGVADVRARVDDRTRVVTMSVVDWSSGARIDLAEIGAFCRERGILFCVDGIQGVGAVQVDVEAARIDCLAAGGHKWLLAPEGCGFLYVSDRVVDSVSSVLHGWKSVTHADTYLPYHFEPRPDAAKFEPGSPSVLGTIALGAAVDLLLEIGPEAVERRLFELNDHLATRLRSMGAEIVSPWEVHRRSGIVVFKHGDDAPDLSTALCREGFATPVRNGGIRVAPHFYLNEADLDRFADAVERLA